MRPHVRRRARAGSRTAASGRPACGEQRALAVHDLVVRERQDEVLVPGVDHRERELVVVEAAVHRLLREVLERVVHPAHVPLEAEAEPAEVGRARHPRPGGRLLRDREHARLAVVQHLVQLLQERDRLQVLAAAELVRHPLALLARVVEVEHRRDRVDAEAVGVELAHPVERVREQEVPHLVPAEVEDQRAPVGMRAAARILVLVQRRAVEAGERELVPREVRGHPVEDDADPGLVQRVHEARGTRPARPSSTPARRSRSPGSPRSRRTDGASPAGTRRA